MDLTSGVAAFLFGTIGYFAMKVFDAKRNPISKSFEVEPEFLFSRSNHSVQKRLAKLIDDTQHSLDIAVYIITDTELNFHIQNAKSRGVIVRIITDSNQSKEPYSNKALNKMHKSGVPIKVNNFDGLMHMKLLISDNKTVALGSYNFSKSAENKNEEIIMILKSNARIEPLTKKFTEMWNDDNSYYEYKRKENFKYA
jgi:phosphatidylserine/phosphatidylglycerophosphate/cardiolipin synthase-like enzyme